jgi:hypothetical protein
MYCNVLLFPHVYGSYYIDTDGENVLIFEEGALK